SLLYYYILHLQSTAFYRFRRLDNITSQSNRFDSGARDDVDGEESNSITMFGGITSMVY
ncbi:MAG: hypothetical protein ACI8RD_008317, partial [Bacillariaceae sp.]